MTGWRRIKQNAPVSGSISSNIHSNYKKTTVPILGRNNVFQQVNEALQIWAKKVVFIISIHQSETNV
jgi:hypothetical protein